MKENLPYGEKAAIALSKVMATWKFIFLLVAIIGFSIQYYQLVQEGAKLDVFNLFISLFTLFIDIIILKAAISLRNMDRTISEIILKVDRKILREENETQQEIKQIHAKINEMIENVIPKNS